MFETANKRSFELQTSIDLLATSTALLVPGGTSETLKTREKLPSTESARPRSLQVGSLRLHREIFVDRPFEIPNADFLIIAERQAVLGAGFEPLLLQEQIVGILIENGAEARIHALGFGERLIVGRWIGSAGSGRLPSTGTGRRNSTS